MEEAERMAEETGIEVGPAARGAIVAGMLTERAAAELLGEMPPPPPRAGAMAAAAVTTEATAGTTAAVTMARASVGTETAPSPTRSGGQDTAPTTAPQPEWPLSQMLRRMSEEAAALWAERERLAGGRVLNFDDVAASTPAPRAGDKRTAEAAGMRTPAHAGM
eukprot:921805-Pleurochrysis_carterae.AAC.1